MISILTNGKQSGTLPLADESYFDEHALLHCNACPKDRSVFGNAE
jgi:hypothetical protein